MLQIFGGVRVAYLHLFLCTCSFGYFTFFVLCVYFSCLVFIFGLYSFDFTFCSINNPSNLTLTRFCSSGAEMLTRPKHVHIESALIICVLSYLQYFTCNYFLYIVYVDSVCYLFHIFLKYPLNVIQFYAL